MGIEWSRLQPSADPRATTPPPFSTEAARLYAKIMAAAMDRGIFPAVTLHHFTEPMWAGTDFWLDRNKVKELFGAYLEFAITEINRVLVEELGKQPIPYYITINEPFMIPISGYFLSALPHGERKGLDAAIASFENLLMGHVMAYRTIHRIYKEKGWKRPTVTVNMWCAAIYQMDKIAQDLLLARTNGVERSKVSSYLQDQQLRFNSLVRSIPYLRGPQSLKRWAEGKMESALKKKMGESPMPALTDLIYEGDDPRLLDAVGFDYYDPFPLNLIDLTFPRVVRVRTKPWQWCVNPAALGAFIESYSWTAGDLPIHILENGMCNRGAGTEGWPRDDLARRDDVLKATFFEMLKSIKKGIKVGAYYYWSLFDNYEWGSFQPRFGLFAVDFEHEARRLPRDIMGNNAAGAYSQFIKAFRADDPKALREMFLTRNYPEVAV